MDKLKPVRLNVIVPCYKPPEGWEAALADRVFAFQKNVSGIVDSLGLIVVNDGSPINATEDNFNRLRHAIPDVKVVSYEENRGKGYALRKGVAESEADFHLLTDADFPYDMESMKRIVVSLKENGGIAAGNRDTQYYTKVPLSRRIISKVFRWILRNLLRQPISDSQCGLKGFDNEGKKVFMETSIDRFLFDLEFLMLAKDRVAITPVPVVLREGVIFSKVGMKILTTEGWNFLKILFTRKGG
ncbi:MAG: glycosyltransferase [Saprospiraceae bacterium]|nr:glycosyltransferase [Saprospiraceae bacterium]MCB9344837.1 glycosyltransferase [Lewinellaceae bacterium]